VICGTCHGDRVLIIDPRPEKFTTVPCPTCEGWGIVHCCEGECAQPEKETPDE